MLDLKQGCIAWTFYLFFFLFKNSSEETGIWRV